MTASGPTALPAQYAKTTPAKTLATAGHDDLHVDIQDEERALWTKLGLGASTPSANTVLRGTGAGTSAFGKVVAADISAEAWTAFTPTLTQSGSVTITVNYARYRVVGKVAYLQVMVTATTAGTVSNAIVIGAIPSAIQPLQTGASRAVGSALIVDASTSVHYQANVITLSTTTLQFIASGYTNYWGNDPAIALANGDTISFSITYEIA